MTIKVWNPTDRPVWLKSFDGDSVAIGPKAKGVQVANKFNWQVPSILKVKEHTSDEHEAKNDPCRIVRGRSPFVARKPKQQVDAAGRPFTNDRSAKQMRDFIEAKKVQRELAAQRAAAAANANTSAAAIAAGAFKD